jgi:hypothetical protein
MANDAFTQQALAQDSTFEVRVRTALIAQAIIVLAEAPLTISAITIAADPVLTTSAHGLATGRTVSVTIAGSNSTPSIDGVRAATVVSATQLKIVGGNTTGAGTAGTFTLSFRAIFARQVLQDSVREAVRVAPILVTRTNLMAFTTSYDFPSGKIVTAAGDPDIASQVATDWNIYAGV